MLDFIFLSVPLTEGELQGMVLNEGNTNLPDGIVQLVPPSNSSPGLLA